MALRKLAVEWRPHSVPALSTLTIVTSPRRTTGPKQFATDEQFDDAIAICVNALALEPPAPVVIASREHEMLYRRKHRDVYQSEIR